MTGKHYIVRSGLDLAHVSSVRHNSIGGVAEVTLAFRGSGQAPPCPLSWHLADSVAAQLNNFVMDAHEVLEA